MFIELIFYFVRSNEFRKEAEEHFEGSAGQQRVSTDFISNYLFPLPPTLAEQERIAAEVSAKMADIEKLRDAAEKQLEAAKAMNGAILRDYFDFEEKE